MVGLVVHYSLPNPVWSGALVGNTHLFRDIRRADVDDKRLLHQLSISIAKKTTRHKVGTKCSLRPDFPPVPADLIVPT